jgi:hypothetical protein
MAALNGVTLVEGPVTSFCDLVVGVPVIATGTATATWGEKNVPPPGNLGPGAGTIHLLSTESST